MGSDCISSLSLLIFLLGPENTEWLGQALPFQHDFWSCPINLTDIKRHKHGILYISSAYTCNIVRFRYQGGLSAISGGVKNVQNIVGALYCGSNVAK